MVSLSSFFAVKSFGTENRDAPKKVPPREEVYEYIVFRGQDIKDLHVCEAPKKGGEAQSSQLHPDPAIVQVCRIPLWNCCTRVCVVTETTLFIIRFAQFPFGRQRVS